MLIRLLVIRKSHWSSPLAFSGKWNVLRAVSTASKQRQSDAVFDDKTEYAITDYAGKNVLRSKDTSQLWRSLFILKASSIDTFVKHADRVLLLTRRYLWKPLFDRIMMKTFYGQFASGISIESSKETVSKLQSTGIRPMMMVPIETVMFQSDAEEEKILKGNYNSMRTCIYGESVFEKNGFAQLKLTALCNKKLLLEMNKHLIDFEKEHKETGAYDIRTMSALIEEEKYENIHIPELGEQYSIKLQVLMKRLNELAQYCKDSNVRMMIDAEQTYLQAALGYLVLVLQAKFNKEEPVVYNTYQCFRKDTLNRIRADCKLAQELGFKNAGKLVRGAYMLEERRLAKEGGYEDPINESFDATTNMYHSCVTYLLPLIKEGNAGIMIASHNENTVDFVKDRMQTYAIPKNSDYLCFGQIFGMCDHVSYSLAEDGYKPFKSVPYGPIDDTILYLSRRAQENRSVMARTQFERKIIGAELRQRAKSAIM